MNKINEALVMMAEQKETFEVNGKKFQVIEVKDAEQQPDYSHLVGKWVRCTVQEDEQDTNPDMIRGKYYPVTKIEYGIIYIKDEYENYGWTLSCINTIPFDLSNPSDTNPDEKPLWEKANEKMWEYKESYIADETNRNINDCLNYLRTKSKHVSAYLFLSKFADLCNDGRVVDWMDDRTDKYLINAYENHFNSQIYANTRHHIAFLDKEARNYSLKVHEQIWKDYWGIE